jgi:hypothetical protein
LAKHPTGRYEFESHFVLLNVTKEVSVERDHGF